MVFTSCSIAGLLACFFSLFSPADAQQRPPPELDHIPRITPEYDVWYSMDQALLGVLSKENSVAFSVSQWGPGWLPWSCFQHEWLGSLDEKDFVAYNVTFDDCSEPFVVCRHKDTLAHPGLIFSAIARLPAGIRQWAGNFVAIPTVVEDYSGWQNGPTIYIQDMYWTFPGLLIHEMTHAVDLIKLGGYYSNNWNYYSRTQEWISKVDTDNMLPTDYAANNHIEDFAEIARIYAYDYYVEGGLAALPPPVSQLHNQLSHFDSLLSDDFKLGQQCTAKVESSYPVAVAIAQFRGSNIRPGPQPNTTVSTVPKIEVPEEALRMSPNCTIHLQKGRHE